ERGNALTKTDPLGNTTRSTYQAFTLAESPFTRTRTFTDALGNTTAYDYDPRGTPSSRTDPTGHAVSVFTRRDGNPIVIRDADRNTTQFEYDAAGNVARRADALGHATAYTHDAGGRELTSTTTLTAADGTVRTLTTGTAYDPEGRVVAVTDAEGGVTRTE